MFNRTGFNQTKFNTTSNSDVYLYGTLSGAATLSAEFNSVFTCSTTLLGDSSVDGALYRQIHFSGSVAADGTITAEVIRIVYFSDELYADSNIEAIPRHYRKEIIEYMGEFKPGDIIVIDSKKKTVTINGQNASHLAEGFLRLLPGTNEITYEDNEGSRTVDIKIQHREKYLY